MALVRLSESQDGVVTLTLNDPDRRNAMGREMAKAFREHVENVSQRDGLRAVILTGAGSAFAAGGNLEMLKQKATVDAETNRVNMLDFYDDFLSILELPAPTIAAINGHAIGAGFCLALACEFRVLATTAKVGLTFTKLGLHPGMGATLLLPRIVGAAVANDLLISGRLLAATEAVQLGLANELATQEEVLNRASKIATSLIGCGPDSIAGLLQTIRPPRAELQAALEREAAEQARNYASAEFTEGIAAALERRPPVF